MSSEKYRSLHISDIHMSNSLPHAKQVNWRGVTDRLADQLALWDRVYRVAERAQCEAIYIGGDLFDHSRVDAITLTETFRALSKSPVPVFIIPGNHDGVNTRGERFTVEALSEIRGCTYMTTGELYCPRPWLTFWPLEFSPIERTREALKAMKLGGGVNVLLMHNSIVGCTHGGWTCEEGQGLEASELTTKFDHVISGHFHDPQLFGKNGRYLGAPMHHRYDDIGRKAGFWVMEFRESGKRKEAFVDGGAPRFHVIDYPADKLLKARVGDYIRVRVRCTHAELVNLQSAVDRFVAKLCENGARASWVHDPVYHHTARLPVDESGAVEVLTPRKMVSSYVETVEVDTHGLDRKALRRMGREIFAAVEGQWRG